MNLYTTMQKSVREETNYAEDIETNTTFNDRYGIVYLAYAWLLFYGRKLVCSVVSGKRASYYSVTNDDIYNLRKWWMDGGNEIWNNHDNHWNLCHTV